MGRLRYTADIGSLITQWQIRIFFIAECHHQLFIDSTVFGNAMSIRVLSAIILALFAASNAERDPLSQCSWLSDAEIAPLIYLSQSEIAVIAFYSRLHFQSIKEGRQTSIIITPACYIKGYSTRMEIEAWWGYQKCKVAELSSLKEHPSLFFLRRDRVTNKWLILNGGEYLHRVDTTGLLFGVGPGAENFPQICGLQRRRIPIDKSKCQSMVCRGYCNFNLAPSDNCKNKTELIRSRFGVTLKDIPAFGTKLDTPSKAGAKDPSVTYAPGAEGKESVKPEIVNSGISKNGAQAMAQTSSVFMSAVIVAWYHTRQH